MLLDPPYEQTAALVPALLPGLVAGWLAPGATVVCEYDRSGRGLPALPEGLTIEASKRYGQVGVDFLRWDPVASR